MNTAACEGWEPGMGKGEATRPCPLPLSLPGLSFFCFALSLSRPAAPAARTPGRSRPIQNSSPPRHSPGPPANQPRLHLNSHLSEKESSHPSPASGFIPPGSKVHSVWSAMAWGWRWWQARSPLPGLRMEPTLQEGVSEHEGRMATFCYKYGSPEPFGGIRLGLRFSQPEMQLSFIPLPVVRNGMFHKITKRDFSLSLLVHTPRKGHRRTHQEGQEECSPQNPTILRPHLGLQPPELREKKGLLCKPPSVRCFPKEARAHQDSNTGLVIFSRPFYKSSRIWVHRWVHSNSSMPMAHNQNPTKTQCGTCSFLHSNLPVWLWERHCPLSCRVCFAM